MEASALARKVAAADIPATISFAGRVANVKSQPVPTRIGGFGGPEGLVAYMKRHRITHVIDATHPFAAQMSRNAVQACVIAGVPLVALTRAPWRAQDGDKWHHVASISNAVQWLNGPARRVFLAVGRMHLDDFSVNPQHFTLLRLVDAPTGKTDFPNAEIIVARGPFSYEGDLALLQRHRIDLVVSKNAGGTGARAKIDAARDLGLEVLMIDRPDLPPRREMHDVEDVIDWLTRHSTDLGV